MDWFRYELLKTMSPIPYPEQEYLSGSAVLTSLIARNNQGLNHMTRYLIHQQQNHLLLLYEQKILCPVLENCL